MTTRPSTRLGSCSRARSDFLERLLHDADKPIFLIVDGHPVHKAEKVRDFAGSIPPRLEIFHFPPSSPDLDPDELVGNDRKNSGIGRPAIAGSDQLAQAGISCPRVLQNSPARIASHFLAPTTRYAAGEWVGPLMEQPVIESPGGGSPELTSMGSCPF